MDVRPEAVVLDRHELSNIFFIGDNFPDLASMAAQHLIEILPPIDIRVQELLRVGASKDMALKATKRREEALSTLAAGQPVDKETLSDFFVYDDRKEYDGMEFPFPLDSASLLGSFCLAMTQYKQGAYSRHYQNHAAVVKRRDIFERQHPSTEKGLIERFLPKLSKLAKIRNHLSWAVRYEYGEMESSLTDYESYKDSFYKILAILPEQDRVQLEIELPELPLIGAKVS